MSTDPYDGRENWSAMSKLNMSSFERFGDDLSEVILSYLSFNDRFRFECVSKQFQRLVFNTVNELIVYNKFGYGSDSVISYNKILVKMKTLRSVLKKCPNIKTVEIWKFTDIEEEIDLIVKYCSNLIEIKTDLDQFSDQLIEKFCHKFGPQLKKLNSKANEESNLCKVLKMCPQIEEFNGYLIDYEDFFDGNQVLLKNLKSFRFYYSDEDIKRMEIIAENNKNSLKSIELCVAEEVEEKQLTGYLKIVSKLRRLRCLKAYFASHSISVLMERFLIQLSECCLNLESINISTQFNEFNDILRVYNCLNRFKQLKTLKFSNYSRKLSQPIPESVITTSFDNCKNLNSISIDGNSFILGKEFFKSIVNNCQRLQSISCSNVDNSELVLDLISDQLKHLRSIDFKSIDKNIQNKNVVYLIQKCPKIGSIKLTFNEYSETNMNLCTELKEKHIDIIRQTHQMNCDIKLFD